MFQRPTPPEINTDLIIIGSGVTGIAAANLLADTDLDFWLLGSPFESQLAKAGELEGTPLPEGTVGLKYIESEFEKLKSKRIQHRSSLCTGIENKDRGFLVKTKFQNFSTPNILIVTGAKQKSLGFEGEDKYFRNGISDCTVCDFPLFRDRAVAVVGNHEYTIRAAKLMRRYAKSVALLWYNNGTSPDLPDIDVFSHVQNLRAFGDETLTHVVFDHEGGSTKLEIRGLFVEGEPFPASGFLKGTNIKLHNGYIHVDKNYMTSIEGIWAAGDVTGRTSNYEQAKLDGELVAKQLIEDLIN